MRTGIAAMTLAFVSGCYVVPVTPDGTLAYPATGVPVASASTMTAGAVPIALAARLYPANDVAAQHGMLTGTVTSTLTGKGRFQLEYHGERLIGEATRVQGDDRRGIANAYGARGTYMSCDYQMRSRYQGSGTCTVSDGALYSVHLGG